VQSSKHLVAAAEQAGFTRIRLDSPDFMTATHALCRSFGFVDIEPYPESEIPDNFKALFGVLGSRRVRAVRFHLLAKRRLHDHAAGLRSV